MKPIKHTVAPSTDNQPLNAGFTLVELMVTVAVLGIIVSIATPSIGTQMANARIKSTAATLSNALSEAKSESVILRKSVMVNYSNNSDAVGIISIEVEAPNLTAYAGPALYFTKPPTETGSGGSGSTETGTGIDVGVGVGTGGTGIGVGVGVGTGGTGTGIGVGVGVGTGGTGIDIGIGVGTGGTDTGETGGTDTGGTNTGGIDSISAPTVRYGVVKTYDYSAKTTIKASSTATIFRPNRNVDSALTYTICDTNTSAKAMQVTVSSLGIISKKVGGLCTDS